MSTIFKVNKVKKTMLVYVMFIFSALVGLLIWQMFALVSP